MAREFGVNDQRNPSFDATLLRETERAYQFVIDDEEYWVPKTQCDWDPSARDQSEGRVVIAEWLAIEKGLV